MTPIKSVLFVCNMNSIRSPMGSRQLHARQLYGQMGRQIRCESAGLHIGGKDELTQEVLAEIGIEMDDYYSKTIGDIELNRFDLVIALTIEAAGELRKLIPLGTIEYWEIEDPSTRIAQGECALDAYRAVRDSILEKISDRFPLTR